MNCIKPRIIFAVCFILFSLSASLSAHATIVTQTWEADVTFVYNTSAYTIGDVISWQVTYDNAGTSITIYYDGPNTVAELGAGDDFIRLKECITGGTDTGCTHYYKAWEYLVLSEATYAFELSMSEILASSSLVSFDDTLFRDNQSRMYVYITGQMGFKMEADEFKFEAFNVGVDSGSMYYYGFTDTGVLDYTNIQFSAMRMRSEAVPEPSVIALMVLGLLGFSVSRHRLQK